MQMSPCSTYFLSRKSKHSRRHYCVWILAGPAEWIIGIKVIRRTAPRNSSSGCLFYIWYFAATCFGPCWPSSGGILNCSRKLSHSQRIRCFVLLGLAYYYYYYYYCQHT
jgi:hypothetical protein